MYDLYYSFGKLVCRFVSPEYHNENPHYSKFMCEKTDYNVEYIIDYTDKIEVKGKFATKKTFYELYTDGNIYRFYYRNDDCVNFYALREMDISSPFNQKIYYLSKYKNKIWQRVMINTMGFEDIALINDSCVFHSSFIVHNGEAIIFTAPCQTGKSTQAELWKKHRGAEIINGDKSLLYYQNGRVYASGIPFSGSSNYCEKGTYPVKAIVYLSQAKTNIVKELKSIEAFKAVYSGMYQSFYSSEQSQMAIDIAQSIASNTKVFSLACLPDESAVAELEKNI